jgi:hypothetical protein
MLKNVINCHEHQKDKFIKDKFSVNHVNRANNEIKATRYSSATVTGGGTHSDCLHTTTFTTLCSRH